jgi:hypothetical protein
VLFQDLTASAAKIMLMTALATSARTAVDASTGSTHTLVSAHLSGPASTVPKTWMNVPAATTPVRTEPRVPTKRVATPVYASMDMKAKTVKRMSMIVLQGNQCFLLSFLHLST